MPTGESEIKGLLATGDARALAVIYDTYGDTLFRYCAVVSGSMQAAEDIVQDVFVRIAESRAQVAAAQHTLAYLLGIARNLAIHYLRSQRKAMGQALVSVTDVPFRTRDDDASDETEATRVNVALMKLPIEQREVVAMKVFDGLTLAAIAGLLDISANTAASRYRYGIARLNSLLKGPCHVG
jgi:RNA polymerase sigma-70 factor, ECF subfamily